MATPVAHLARVKVHPANWSVSALFGSGRRQLAGHPAPEIGKRARSQRFFARQGLRGGSAELAVAIECRGLLQWGKQAKVHIHWLERGGAGIDGVDMAAGNVR